MLIIKVMRYLLINESSLLGKRWYTQWYTSVISTGTEKAVPVNGGYIRCTENALLGLKIYAGGGRTEREDSGEEKIHSLEGNRFVKFSVHGHTPQTLVLLKRVEMKMNYSFLDHQI